MRLNLPASRSFRNISFRFSESPLGRFRAVWWLLFVMLSMQSCRQKDLMWEIRECHLSVRFDWIQAPEAAPDGMTLYLFPVDARSQIWRFDIAGRDGGFVELPEGNYRLIAYNNDLPRISFTDIHSFDDFSATLRFRNDSVAYAPGILYCGVVGHIRIGESGVDYSLPDGVVVSSPDGLIRCFPSMLCSCYTIEVRSVTGIEHLKSASATLGGLAGSMRLSDGIAFGGPASIRTDLSAITGGNALRGMFHAFGTSTGTTVFPLTVTVVRDDGKVFAKQFDVTSQVVNSPDARNVIIIVDHIEIPVDDIPPASEDVGIEVGVDGWSEITINYET